MRPLAGTLRLASVSGYEALPELSKKAIFVDYPRKS